MSVETNKDDTAVITGSHEGNNGASALFDRNTYFDVLATVGARCYNTTQSSSGLIIASTKDTLTVDGVTWNLNDSYEVYRTATKDSYISNIKTTKILGRKVTDYYNDENEMDEPDDVFSSGQPDMTHK